MIDDWHITIGNGSAINHAQSNMQTGHLPFDILVVVSINVALILLSFFAWRGITWEDINKIKPEIKLGIALFVVELILIVAVISFYIRFC
jgi:preprotein translocase subunit Sec61beta